MEKLLKSSRVRWGPPVAGALVAIAAAFVLCAFGAAFGAASQSPTSGLAVLSGAWLVLTPLASVLLGTVIASALDRRRRAYLNGLLVWSICVAYAALLLAASAGFRAQAEWTQGTMPGLWGLAACLGLVGALIGAPIGRILAGRRGAIEMTGRPEIGQETAGQEGAPAAAARPGTRPAAPAGEPASMRH
ncbi:MAG TPA: hypothetical protein VMU15_08345 [Anaeromyxobacter sp.]|nr:hypothetical protein [Anaeromyxobacter sp.]